VRSAVAVLLIAAACGDNLVAPPPDDDRCRFHTAADDAVPAPISTPRWAFRPWISKDISTGDDTRAFVAGFRERGIPVGAVVLDSPWETHYNTFVPDPARYPGFPALVHELHEQGIRLVLWTTEMVNTSGLDLEEGGNQYQGPAANFQEGKDCGFYVNGGKDYLWWKGTGAAIDFSDPDARGWWHRQQDPLLDLGIDGWKLDFAEQYITEGRFRGDGGDLDLQAYGESYYRDFYAYGRARRGPGFVTMVRPWDESYGFPGRFYARPEHAPVAWVGDNRRDFIGLVDALDHVFRSARAGYTMVGSDVGGYLDRNDLNFDELVPFDSLVFARWTAVGALLPFMQLHGRANITPWTVPDHVDETVALYRYWATLHDELVPFLYSAAVEADGGGPPLIRPIGAGPEAWAGDWRWQLGDAFLVAPILDATGVRDVALPAGARWYDWWRPDADPVDGGTTIAAVDVRDRARIPLYVRDGAIVPMQVATDVTGLGTAASAGALTVLIWPAAAESSLRVHEGEDGLDENDRIDVTAEAVGAGARVGLSRLPRPAVLRVRLAAAPSAVRRDGAPIPAVADRDAVLSATGDAWAHDAPTRALWIRVTPAEGGAVVTAE